MPSIVSGTIIFFLIAIVISLGSGLFFLVKDKSASRRAVNALTVRITLSVLLFLALLAGLLTGVITPNRPF